jgi:hypothetical protein
VEAEAPTKTERYQRDQQQFSHEMDPFRTTPHPDGRERTLKE